jgi:hypothetical protein
MAPLLPPQKKPTPKAPFLVLNSPTFLAPFDEEVLSTPKKTLLLVLFITSLFYRFQAITSFISKLVMRESFIN